MYTANVTSIWTCFRRIHSHVEASVVAILARLYYSVQWIILSVAFLRGTLKKPAKMFGS